MLDPLAYLSHAWRMAHAMGPLSEPFGVISDIHGHPKALRLVLDRLRDEEVEHVFALGDHVWGGPAPFEAWKILQEEKVRCLKGASEMAIDYWVKSSDVRDQKMDQIQADQFEKTIGELGEVVVRKLRDLDESLRLPTISGAEVLLIHGTLRDALDEIDPNDSDDEILDAMLDDRADAIFVGSSHLAFRRAIEGGPLVVGVGSVGEAPGGGYAHFAIVTPKPDRLDVSQHWIEL